MNNSHLKLFIILILAASTADGSRLVLEVSPQLVAPAMTTNMTLRCSVQAAAASGAVIGRRQATDRNLAGQPTSLQFITSMVVTRDGHDVATLTEHLAASVYDVTPGVQVSGQLTPGQTEQGFLQLTWPYPTKHQLGSYSCNVTGVDKKGHSFEFYKSIDVNEPELTLEELATHIIELKQDRDRMTKEITANKAEIASLKQKVFFSAGLSSFLNLTSDRIVVYDLVLSAKGGGYDHTTGVFTCPVPGYYTFHMTALAQHGKDFALRLLHNGKQVISIWSTSSDVHSDGMANSATILLAKGDNVKVVSYAPSYLVSTSYDTHVTFNGQLISLP